MRIRRSNWRMATLQRAALVLALAPLVFAALALAALALAPLALAPLALAALALAPRQRFHLSPRLSVVLYACDGAVIRRQRPRAAWPWPARAHFSFAVASTARFSSNLSATKPHSLINSTFEGATNRSTLLVYDIALFAVREGFKPPHVAGLMTRTKSDSKGPSLHLSKLDQLQLRRSSARCSRSPSPRYPCSPRCKSMFRTCRLCSGAGALRACEECKRVRPHGQPDASTRRPTWPSLWSECPSTCAVPSSMAQRALATEWRPCSTACGGAPPGSSCRCSTRSSSYA